MVNGSFARLRHKHFVYHGFLGSSWCRAPPRQAAGKPLDCQPRQASRNSMTDAADLIRGDELKAAALQFTGEMRTKVEREQNGLHSIFDSWFTRVLTQLIAFDPARAWEDS